MVSIGAVVLPSEVLLHQWQHGNNMYSIYSERGKRGGGGGGGGGGGVRGRGRGVNVSVI